MSSRGIGHGNECEKGAAEISDEALFKEPPKDECPICFVPVPSGDQISYQVCCGKSLCFGCIGAIREEAIARGGTYRCPFCRMPKANSREEEVNRIEKRMESNDAITLFMLGGAYIAGRHDMPVDRSKGLELWLRAGELGCADANHALGLAYVDRSKGRELWLRAGELGCVDANHAFGLAYERGKGVKANGKKAKYYLGLAAIAGNVCARYDLGAAELQVGNVDRGLKHFMIAARAGHEASLEKVNQGFLKGSVTKDEYERSLRGYQESKDEMKSEMREKAAAVKG